MKTKLFLLLIVPLFALFLMIRLSAEDLPVQGSKDASGEVVAPAGTGQDQSKPGSSASAGDATIMTAEQGEELQKKINKYVEQQEKVLEKIGQMEKEMEFVKAASRNRGRVVGP